MISWTQSFVLQGEKITFFLKIFRKCIIVFENNDNNNKVKQGWPARQPFSFVFISGSEEKLNEKGTGSGGRIKVLFSVRSSPPPPYSLFALAPLFVLAKLSFALKAQRNALLGDHAEGKELQKTPGLYGRGLKPKLKTCIAEDEIHWWLQRRLSIERSGRSATYLDSAALHELGCILVTFVLPRTTQYFPIA